MKTRVDIISGFLESGKTTYIKQMLNHKSLSDEKIVIIQLENGEIDIDINGYKDKQIFIECLDWENGFDSATIISILDKYYPDKVIIEYNGMLEMERVFSLFEDRSLRKRCVIGNIVCLVDVSTFEVYMSNMSSILTDHITFSDIIVLSKVTHVKMEKLESIKKKIKAFNKDAQIFKAALDDYRCSQTSKDYVGVASIYGTNDRVKFSDILIYIYFVFIVLYFAFSARGIIYGNLMEKYLSGFKVFNTIFISILMQVFPFMLVGVFVSSIMHVFISNETIVKFFPTRFGLGFITAMFGGLLLPVCECAIVPVTARLVKKGVALPVAVTFMLSAPIINPIVIISTIYAFPGQPQITFYRIYFGLVIAFIIGLVLTFFPETKSTLLDNDSNFSCDCMHCDNQLKDEELILQKIRRMFLHAGEEFFSAGKYLVLGAFLTSLIQTIVPRDIFSELWGRNGLGIAMMMGAAFLFSVCSTSDAFIARSFYDRFSIGSIMGFLVFGPMLDVKNVLMLFSSFRKGFVIKLIFIIIFFNFTLLYLLTSILM